MQLLTVLNTCKNYEKLISILALTRVTHNLYTPIETNYESAAKCPIVKPRPVSSMPTVN